MISFSKLFISIVLFCFMISAFPPTCQEERWFSPGRLCKLQEIKRKLWQQVNTHIVTTYSTYLLSCCRSPGSAKTWLALCHRYVTRFSSPAQGVCSERGGCWYQRIFQCHAGHTTSLQIWKAAVRRHPGQPSGYIYVSNLWRPSPTQTLW